MIKRWAYVCILMFFCSSTLLIAQEKSSFLKTLGKVAKALSEDSNSNSGSGENSSGSQSPDGKGKQQENKENSNTSGEEKITTPHSDLALEFKGCTLRGSNVEVDLLVTNKASADGTLTLWSFTAFDNQGNQYSNFRVYIGDKNDRYSVSNTLPKDIPVKMKIIIPDVDTNANKIARITLTSQSGNITMENISIPR